MKTMIMILSMLIIFSANCKKSDNATEQISNEQNAAEQSQPAQGTDSNTITLTTLDWEPYIGETMENKGYVYQIIVEAYKKAGKNVKIYFYPWARTVKLSEDGAVDGHFPEYYDEGRLEGWVFSEKFPGGPVGLYKRNKDPIKYGTDPAKNQQGALKSLAKYRFGAVRDYINTKDFDLACGLNIPANLAEADKQKLLSQKYLNIELASSDEENLKKLFGNRVDLIFIDKYVAKYIIVKKYPHYLDSLEFMDPPLEDKPLYVCFSKKAKNYQEKCDLFNEGLAKMKADGSLKEIMIKNGF